MNLCIKHGEEAFIKCCAPLMDEAPFFSPFFSPGFGKFIQQAVDGEPHWISAWTESRPVGLLRYFTKKDHRFGTIYNSNPWFSSPGGCLIADNSPPETRGALLKAFHDIVSADDSCLSATLVLTPQETVHIDTYTKFIPQPCVMTRFNQTLHIAPNENSREFLMRAHTKRCVLKKSYTYEFQYIESNAEEHWDFIHKIHKENMQSVGGKIKPRKHFDAFRECLPPEERVLSLALHHGRAVAGILCLKHQRYMEYLVPVVEKDYRPTQCLSFLIAETIAHNFPQGPCTWNFGGSLKRDDGVYAFKKHWGAQESTYTIISWSKRPDMDQLMQSSQRDALIDAYPFWFVYPY